MAVSSTFDQLNSEFRKGRLCLVLGAGVSIGANLPSWLELIERMYDELKIITKGATSVTDFKLTVQELGGAANLILGNSLKHYFGDDFADGIRNALYKVPPKETLLLSNIKDMARPRRDHVMLDSIISFNFDDLVETTLGKDVPHIAVHDYEVEVPNEALSIFHVHGYVPRKKNPSVRSNIVFSEQSYHDQFNDTFSWSNSIQLYKYINKTCLFIGLSLTDPNMRRLLDVAHRKAAPQKAKHFIILKRTNLGAASSSIDYIRNSDALSLGLSVIWIDDFDEIPNLLSSIYT